MDGRQMVGIFKRDDFGKFEFQGREIQDGQVEATGMAGDKLTAIGIVYKGKIEEAHTASMLITLVPGDQQKAIEQTRLASVFLEIASPEKPNKDAWLAEYLPKIKPTAKQKQPKIRCFWEGIEVKMQHLGQLGGVLITVSEEAKNATQSQSEGAESRSDNQGI